MVGLGQVEGQGREGEPQAAAPVSELDRFLDFLCQSGRLSSDALRRGRAAAGHGGERIDHVLLKLGLVADDALAEGYGEFLGLSVATPSDFPAEALYSERVSRSFLRASKVLPLSEHEGGLILAAADPFDRAAIRAMAVFSGKAVEVRVGRQRDVEAALERLYGEESKGAAGREADVFALATDIDALRDLAGDAPVVKLVSLTIARAVELGASDIHIEPLEAKLRVRYRLDGILLEQDPPPLHYAQAIVSRLKVLANLNIAEQRLPQDGRIRLPVAGRDIDFRISTVPSMHGEGVVLRILDRSSLRLELDSLGFDDTAKTIFLPLLEQPHGILLVTGPTGSGKTTTLYASLSLLNSPERKILTIEDPVEYQLEGVNQVQVQPDIGRTFAHTLRSFLRQDPDIMMVGEIRDLETAQVAIQAALTGHLVLSTLHTNDAASGVTRLMDMGVEDFLITSTLNGIVAQRLVRVLCPACKLPHVIPSALIDRFEIDRSRVTGLHRASGCAGCNFTGYRGRTTILEVLPMTDKIKSLVLSGAEAHRIAAAAVAGGMRTMFRHGLEKALAGQTSLEEVLRVTREG